MFTAKYSFFRPNCAIGCINTGPVQGIPDEKSSGYYEASPEMGGQCRLCLVEKRSGQCGAGFRKT